MGSGGGETGGGLHHLEVEGGAAVPTRRALGARGEVVVEEDGPRRSDHFDGDAGVGLDSSVRVHRLL